MAGSRIAILVEDAADRPWPTGCRMHVVVDFISSSGSLGSTPEQRLPADVTTASSAAPHVGPAQALSRRRISPPGTTSKLSSGASHIVKRGPPPATGQSSAFQAEACTAAKAAGRRDAAQLTGGRAASSRRMMIGLRGGSMASRCSLAWCSGDSAGRRVWGALLQMLILAPFVFHLAPSALVAYLLSGKRAGEYPSSGSIHVLLPFGVV